MPAHCRGHSFAGNLDETRGPVRRVHIGRHHKANEQKHEDAACADHLRIALLPGPILPGGLDRQQFYGCRVAMRHLG